MDREGQSGMRECCHQTQTGNCKKSEVMDGCVHSMALALEDILLTTEVMNFTHVVFHSLPNGS